MGIRGSLIAYLLTASVLSACTTQNNTDVTKTKYNFNFPVFIDHRKIKDDSVNIIWLNDGKHQPLYFGKLSDTIEVKIIYGHIYPPSDGSEEKLTQVKKGKYDAYFLEWGSYKNFKNWDSVKLDIHVDTSQLISNDGRIAYPILIENMFKDTIYIGYGNHIPIITEAKDKNGLWKPIEEKYIYICGTGLKAIILPPREFVVTSVLKYSGNFKTSLRLKFGNNYSREFVGSINETQFESEWDHRGNRKPVPNTK